MNFLVQAFYGDILGISSKYPSRDVCVFWCWLDLIRSASKFLCLDSDIARNFRSLGQNICVVELLRQYVELPRSRILLDSCLIFSCFASDVSLRICWYSLGSSCHVFDLCVLEGLRKSALDEGWDIAKFMRKNFN